MWLGWAEHRFSNGFEWPVGPTIGSRVEGRRGIENARDALAWILDRDRDGCGRAWALRLLCISRFLDRTSRLSAIKQRCRGTDDIKRHNSPSFT